MKELLEDIKLSKVSYLIEILEKGNNKNKLKALKKLEKYKITKKIGLFLIENSTKKFNIENEFGGINSSLVEMCFKEYYEEYTDAIRSVFEQYDENTRNHVLYLLTNVGTPDTLKLYTELVLKYYSDKEYIPIGELQTKPLAYPYIFPKLFQTLKFKSDKNNILILLSHYLNAGVVPKEDLKKYKKLLTDSICKLFEEALKIKFKDTFKGLHNPKYRYLRYYLEIAINIEFYISGRKTKDCLKKLFNINDNQLKLFILDNYIRSGKDISKIDLFEIAKDKASRYALFELLSIYNKIEYMPKYYLDQNFLAESDFYTNFVITSGYETEPKKIKFLKKVTIDNFDYYVFTFNFDHRYNVANNDYLTNYICNQLGIQKYNGEKVTDKFIGISGGFDPNAEISQVVKNPKKLLIDKIEDKEKIDEQINKLVLSNELDTSITNKNIEKEKRKAEKLKLKEQKDLLKLEKKQQRQKLKEQKLIEKAEQEKIKEEQNKLINNEDKIIKENLTDSKEVIKNEKRLQKLEQKRQKQEQKLLEQEQDKLIKNEDKLINENLPDNKKKEKEKQKLEKKLLKLQKKIQKREDKLILNQEKKNKKLEKLNLKELQLVDGEGINISKKKHHMFTYFLLFLFSIFLGLLIYCILYIYGVGSINDNLNEEIYLPAKLENKGAFIEIRGSDIFNQMENEYFVLLYTNAKKKEDKYYRFLNEYIKRDFKIYFVDLKNAENKFLYEGNDLGFTLYGDRLLKVKDHEYEYYVDEKKNILREMETQIDEIRKKEKEEEKIQKEKEKEALKLQQEEQKKQAENKTKEEKTKETKKKKITVKKENKKDKKEIQKIELKPKTLIMK